MAQVMGQITGVPGVCMATLGPGATNLVTGIADAFLDRAPMVAITGQVGSDKLHKESHQFVDIVRKAFRLAQFEKPGPTHIELPENLAAEEVGTERPFRPIVPDRPDFPET